MGIEIRFEIGEKYSNTYEKFSVSSTGFTKEWRSLVGELQKDIDKGNSNAQLSMGLVYRFGIGVSRDSNKAHKLLEKSATKGHTDAQIHLGFMYADGKEVEQDIELAVSWLGKAAVSGSTDAVERLLLLRANNPDIKLYDCEVQEAIYVDQFRKIKRLVDENNSNLRSVKAHLKNKPSDKQKSQLLKMEKQFVTAKKAYE